MSEVFRRMKSAISLSHSLWAQQMTPLLILFAISASIDIQTEDYTNALSSKQETEHMVAQIGMGVWSLVEGILLILILSWGIPKVRELTEAHFEKHPFQESYLGSFLAEYFRVLGNVLLFALLLALPGFYKYCRLIFVPYITIFAKPYREGKIDALALSTDLTRGRLIRLALVIVGSILVGAALEFAPNLIEFFHLLVNRLIIDAINMYLSVWVFAFLYLEFEDAMEKYDWRNADGTNV